MLEGVVPFPPEYAARYRAAGYWEDRALREEFGAMFARFADRVALIDGERTYEYADIDRLSTNLALESAWNWASSRSTAWSCSCRTSPSS